MSVLVVAAVVRRGNDVLLVKQQGPDDPAPLWALPAGRVEQGENLSQAVAREVLEETGLQVMRLGALRCVSHALDPASGTGALALTFEVDEWSGEPQASGTDEFVTECGFFPVEQAVERLSALPWRSMREPSVAAVNRPEVTAQYFEYDDL
ncbi:MAG TPA: NUDIX hydrolase [Chloroflexia bacterium]|nr:NUDIX hydrolase [Chloroflexia bacterium]